MGAAEWDRMIFVNKIIHCQDQWKIISEERACHWSDSKDIKSFKKELQPKRNWIRLNLCLLSQSVARLVTALLATTMPKSFL